jgi:hypothetical protein
MTIAKLHLIPKRPEVAASDKQRCHAIATREDSFPAFPGAVVLPVRCSLPRGHGGAHQNLWQKEWLIRRWRVYEWPND